jgi:excisionase family DNA binding protein
MERPVSQRIAYGMDEAAETAGIGLTKLREEIAAKRLRARKLGSRTIITRDDLVDWAARLPDVHDVRPNTVAKRVTRAEVTDT